MGSLPEGETSPKSISASAVPPSEPGYHAWISASGSHSVFTELPAAHTTTTGLPVCIILSTRIHKSINRGDIIVFWLEEENKILIKRVVGIAGDKIEICDDKVYINGNPEAGVYFKGKTKIGDNDLKIFTIPADSLFVLGDNRENSKDSRSYNNPYISIKDVMGKYKETIYTKRG